LLILCGMCSAADDPKNDPVKKDAELIQGTWVAERSNTEGTETPKAQVEVLRLIVKGDRWNYSIGGGAPVFDPAPKFLLNPSAKPKTLDVISVKQEGKSLLRGIYSIEGDTLTVCFAVGDAERPKEFKSEVGSKSGITVYKRVK